MTLLGIFEPGRWMPRRDETIYDYWMSLSPVAPFFGVAWRFGPDARETVLPARAANVGPASKIDKAAADTVEPIAPVPPGMAPANPPAAKAAPRAENAAPAKPVAPKTAPKAEKSTAEAPPASKAGAKSSKPAAANGKAPAPAPARAAALTAKDSPAPAETPNIRPTMLLDAMPASIDDLKKIKGIGPKLEAELNALGLWQYDQIAKMGDPDLMWLDARLSTLRARPMRDDWVGQAKRLKSKAKN